MRSYDAKKKENSFGIQEVRILILKAFLESSQLTIFRKLKVPGSDPDMINE